jgi:hypothetical protein
VCIPDYESSPIFLKPFQVVDERTKGERIKRWGDETGQAGTVIVPEPTECPSESVKRCLGILAPLSCSVAFEAQKGLYEFLMHRIEQGEEKGVDEQNHAKERCVGPPMTTSGDIPERTRIWHSENSFQFANAFDT